MIFHRVIFFLFGWQCILGEDLENISIESVLDQVAIPTRIINEFLQKPVKTSPSKKFVAYDRAESSTVRYENSNGFVPLIVSTQPYEYEQKRRNLTRHGSDAINGTKAEKLNVDEDPAFTTEARIFLNLPTPSQNRRSFQADDNPNEFELLKVSNGTPAVANYDSFYEHSRDNSKPDQSLPDINYRKSIRNKDRERGKRIQSYMANYDATNGDDGQYSQSETSEDQKKTVYQQDKRQNQYKQDNTGTYRTQKASLPKTNYATMTTTKSTLKTYAQDVEKNEEYRFKSPIMVEPSEYKVNVKFNGQSAQSVVPTSSPQGDTKNHVGSVDSENGESQQLSHIEGTSRNYDSANSRDFFEENPDYMDEIEKPRRVQKTARRRPYHFDSSKKLPKEHRESYDDVYDDQGRKRPNKPKSRHRQKSKPVEILNEEDTYDNEGDTSEGNANDPDAQQNYNGENTWNQVAPNVEVSHSNGYEINQIEKPKLHIVPINILSNFDHATALDNSQGFDITNAMFTGFVHEGPSVSTAAPLVSSSPNYVDQNFISSSTKSPTVPDVIVGQSSFNNPVQAVLMPNQLHQNMLNQYMQSTVSPAVFAVTARPGFSASSTIAPNFQQMLNQVQASFPINQQVLNAQPSQQTFTNLLQPVQSNSNNQLYVNSNGLQGQNLYQFKNVQSTTRRPKTERNESQNKKFNANNGQFLASASLSVGQNLHRQTNNKNSNNKRNNYQSNTKNNYNSNNNKNNDEHDNYNVQNNQQNTKQNLNSFVQPTVVPAILHTGIGLINNQNQQLVQNPFFITNPQQNTQMFQATNDAFESTIKQLQYDIQNNRYQLASIPGVDNIGGASNNINAINNFVNPLQKAQLPLLGAKNVEILNPNLNANAYAINQIPATLVTTPIPIFTTTGFITSKQAYSSTTQDPSGIDRPQYNPINFVPNYDLMKSQSILNSNVVPNNLFGHQNLNLVPLVPGGNFYKHSQGAQVDLANKPKLSSDLEKYAEEMFKESLRTMYNSHRWNNDPQSPGNISLVDNSDLAKLRNELLRIRNNIRDSKIPKDVLEAHHTENKIRTARPDSSIEQPYKNDHKSHSGKSKVPHHHHHHHHSHHHRHKPEINDFLTPPRLNSFISKSPFHDGPPKKRPVHGNGHGPRPNFNYENSRPRPRQGVVPPKSQGSESQASTIVDYRYPIRPNFNQPDYRSSQTYNYPTFTTSFPENDQFKASVEYKSSEQDFYDINHQRTHNLMGLLMKNKQLPPGTQGSYYNDRQAMGQFFDEENKRTQAQSYEDAFRSFQKKSDRQIRPTSFSMIPRRATSKIHKA